MAKKIRERSELIIEICQLKSIDLTNILLKFSQKDIYVAFIRYNNYDIIGNQMTVYL